MSFYKILFNNLNLLLLYSLLFIRLNLAFQLPPVIPTSIIIKNKYLIIYGSNNTQSTDAQFVNVYDLTGNTVKSLTPANKKNQVVIEGYSPRFIPVKADSPVGLLEYGIEASLIKSDIPPKNFLLSVEDNKLDVYSKDSVIKNFTIPGSFPQQGYSIVRVDLQDDKSEYYFIGGIAYSKILNTGTISRLFWKFTVDKNGSGSWEDLSGSTTNGNTVNGIPHLAYHSCANSNNQYIYCVGGMYQEDNSKSIMYESENSKLPVGPNNDLKAVYRFEISTKSWLRIDANGSEECIGVPVIGHSILAYQSNLYLIGGISKLGSSNSSFMPSCRYDTGNKNWSPIKFTQNAKEVKLSIAFQAIQQVNENYFIAGYGYRDTGSPLGPLIGINIDASGYTLVNDIPPPSLSIGPKPDPNDHVTSKGPPTPIYVIIPITVVVTAFVFGIVGFLLYRYKLRNSINQVESTKGKGNPRSGSGGTLFNSVPSHHRATLWSDSITGKLIMPSRAHFRSNGSQEMLIPFSELSDTNAEFAHLDHFQHQPTDSRTSIDLSPMISANQLPHNQFDIGQTYSPSITNLNYLTSSNSDLKITSSSITLGDSQTNLAQTKI